MGRRHRRVNARAPRAYPSPSGPARVGGRAVHVAKRVVVCATAAFAAFAGVAQAAPSDQYVVRNLLSGSAAVPADRIDPNLINPWGLVSSPTSPWWPANQGTNTSTIVPATGAINNTVVQRRRRPDRHRLERDGGGVPDHRRPVELHLQHDVGRDLGLARRHGLRGPGPRARRVLHGPRARRHGDRPAALRRRLQEQPRRGLQRAVGAREQRQVQGPDAARRLRALRHPDEGRRGRPLRGYAAETRTSGCPVRDIRSLCASECASCSRR